MIKNIINIRGLLAALLLSTPLSVVHAAFIDVSSLSVDTVTANVVIGGIVDTGATSSIVPPAEIVMGSYQDPLLSFSNMFSGGSFSGRVYSSSLNGVPAPSATVDTIAGDFSSVDLSSLRIAGTLMLDGPLGSTTSYSFDTMFWPVATDPTSATSYDHTTGDFSLNWAFSDMIMFDVNGLYDQEISTAFDFTLSGNATVVPLPAAIWLFISGMLAVFGFLQKKK